MLHKIGAIMLIAAAVGAELGGMLLCRQFIPDGRGQLYIQEKNTSAQLLIVDDENNARFYPRLPESDSSTVTVQQYAAALYRDYLDRSGKTEEESAFYSENMEGFVSALTGRVKLCMQVFSGVDGDLPDITSAGKINEQKGIFYLRELPVKTSDGRQRLLSIVYDLNREELLYYRLAPAEAPSAAAVSQKSKELVADLEQFLPTAGDDLFFVLPESEQYDMSVYEDDTGSESQKLYRERAYDLQKNYPDNEPARWISDIFWRLSDPENELVVSSYYGETEKTASGTVVYQETAIQRGDAFVTLKLPVDLIKEEYHVFSSGGELMIVFETQTENSMILYYDVSQQQFTGFSL